VLRPGWDSARPSTELQELLAQHRINTTSTHAGSSWWDVERRNLPPLLRLSVHITTTESELEAAVGVLSRGG